MKRTKQDWEKEFDEYYWRLFSFHGRGGSGYDNVTGEVKDFIRQTREQARQEGIEEATKIIEQRRYAKNPIDDILSELKQKGIK